MRAALPHFHVESVELRRKVACPRTADGIDATELFIVVSIPLLVHRNPVFPSDCIDAMARLVIENVIAITDGGSAAMCVPCLVSTTPVVQEAA